MPKKSIWTSAVSRKRSQKWSEIPFRQLSPLFTLFWAVTVFGLSFTQKIQFEKNLFLSQKWEATRGQREMSGQCWKILEKPTSSVVTSDFKKKSSNIKISHKFSGNFGILKKSSSIGHWWSSSKCLRQVHAHILHPVKIYRAVLDFIDA